MTLPGWLAYLVAGLGFGGALAWFLWFQWEQRKRERSYRPIPGSPGMLCVGPATPEKVGRAVGLALVALEQHAGWSPGQLAAALQGVLVSVQATETWDANGVKVGGQEYPANLLVGPSLSALCHEMAHRCQQVIDKIEDPGHLTWTNTGIWAADKQYREEL